MAFAVTWQRWCQQHFGSTLLVSSRLHIHTSSSLARCTILRFIGRISLLDLTICTIRWACTTVCATSCVASVPPITLPANGNPWIIFCQRCFISWKITTNNASPATSFVAVPNVRCRLSWCAHGCTPILSWCMLDRSLASEAWMQRDSVDLTVGQPYSTTGQ